MAKIHPPATITSVKHLINLKNPESLEFVAKAHGAAYAGATAEVSSKWPARKLGFHIEVLSPGKFSGPYHRHQEEEELFIAISGSAMVRQEEQIFQITEGDLVFFETGAAHQFYNHTDQPFKYLALSNHSANDVVEFPDSEKIWSREAKELRCRDRLTVDYWLGEDDPRKMWPAPVGTKAVANPTPAASDPAPSPEA